jgi:hypothetical protein
VSFVLARIGVSTRVIFPDFRSVSAFLVCLRRLPFAAWLPGLLLAAWLPFPCLAAWLPSPGCLAAWLARARAARTLRCATLWLKTRRAPRNEEERAAGGSYYYCCCFCPCRRRFLPTPAAADDDHDDNDDDDACGAGSAIADAARLSAAAAEEQLLLLPGRLGRLACSAWLPGCRAATWPRPLADSWLLEPAALGRRPTADTGGAHHGQLGHARLSALTGRGAKTAAASSANADAGGGPVGALRAHRPYEAIAVISPWREAPGLPPAW